jgi:hypothetical protein
MSCNQILSCFRGRALLIVLLAIGLGVLLPHLDSRLPTDHNPLVLVALSFGVSVFGSFMIIRYFEGQPMDQFVKGTMGIVSGIVGLIVGYLKGMLSPFSLCLLAFGLGMLVVVFCFKEKICPSLVKDDFYKDKN